MHVIFVYQTPTNTIGVYSARGYHHKLNESTWREDLIELLKTPTWNTRVPKAIIFDNDVEKES